jgi:hypothetical protein
MKCAISPKYQFSLEDNIPVGPFDWNTPVSKKELSLNKYQNGNCNKAEKYFLT